MLAQRIRPPCSLLLAGVTLWNTPCSRETLKLHVTQLRSVPQGHHTASCFIWAEISKKKKKKKKIHSLRLHEYGACTCECVRIRIIRVTVPAYFWRSRLLRCCFIKAEICEKCRNIWLHFVDSIKTRPLYVRDHYKLMFTVFWNLISATQSRTL